MPRSIEDNTKIGWQRVYIESFLRLFSSRNILSTFFSRRQFYHIDVKKNNLKKNTTIEDKFSPFYWPKFLLIVTFYR